MAGGGLEEEELAEGIILPPSKVPKLDLPVAQSSQSQPIEAKKVAYLRDMELVDLLPIKSNIRWINAEEEGSAAPFISGLLVDLEKRLDPGTEEHIRLKEIRLYLANEGRSDLAMHINSSPDFDEKAPLDLRDRFQGKDWHFNTCNDVGGLDHYQLLCLGPRGNADDLVALWNKIGNTLDADLLYVDYCTAMFRRLEWDDTAYVGFEKAISLKSCCPYEGMKTLIIPWVLNEWTTYRNDERKLEDQIEQYYQLWDSAVNEGGQNQGHDIVENNELTCVFEYVKQSFIDRPWMNTAYPFVKKYFEKFKPVKPLNKSYLSYMKKKIAKAIELGVIKKDNEGDFNRVGQFLKKIEDGYPDFFDSGKYFLYD